MNSPRTPQQILVVLALAAALAACTDARQERLEGAQRALAALPDVEVIRSDAAAGQIVVRSRLTGTTTTIDVESSVPGAPSVASGSSAGAGGDTGTGDPGRDALARGQAAAGDMASTSGEFSSSVPSGGSMADGDAPALTAGTAAAAAPADAADAAPLSAQATVIRDGQGRVSRIEGSGFSIERSTGPSGATVPAGTPATRSAAAAPGSTPTGGTVVERRRVSTPIVCGAGETRALQGVDLDVPGAGIVAERGCTLTIANARVRAGGWGIVVNPGANVRIDDSLIEGRTGALDLYPGGSLSAWATTFRGALGRPVATPQFVDRGGNTWE